MRIFHLMVLVACVSVATGCDTSRMSAGQSNHVRCYFDSFTGKSTEGRLELTISITSASEQDGSIEKTESLIFIDQGGGYKNVYGIIPLTQVAQNGYWRVHRNHPVRFGFA